MFIELSTSLFGCCKCCKTIATTLTSCCKTIYTCPFSSGFFASPHVLCRLAQVKDDSAKFSYKQNIKVETFLNATY
jgi:hypothetical protein